MCGSRDNIVPVRIFRGEVIDEVVTAANSSINLRGASYDEFCTDARDHCYVVAVAHESESAKTMQSAWMTWNMRHALHCRRDKDVRAHSMVM